jgi:hypothetical protein
VALRARALTAASSTSEAGPVARDRCRKPRRHHHDGTGARAPGDGRQAGGQASPAHGSRALGEAVGEAVERAGSAVCGDGILGIKVGQTGPGVGGIAGLVPVYQAAAWLRTEVQIGARKRAACLPRAYPAVPAGSAFDPSH